MTAIMQQNSSLFKTLMLTVYKCYIKLICVLNLTIASSDMNITESRWLCGNTIASDTHGPGSTPGGTVELDPGYHPFVG